MTDQVARADMLHDVAIVGFGPTGALLANLLGLAGLSVVVLERDAGIHPLPRAVHFDGEVMRIFQAAGLDEAVARLARPSTQGMHFVNAEGRTLLVRRGVDGPGPQGWINNWYAHQPDLDAVLRAGIERFPNVTVRTGHEVTGLSETSTGVRVNARRQEDAADARPIEAEARYVVGCDGARSLVRQTMGSPHDDLGLHQPWLVVDLLVPPEIARARGLQDYTVQLCDPARPMTIVHVGANRRRWEIMLMPGDDPRAVLAPERTWDLLARWLEPADAEIERAAVYTFHSVIARGWRRGRLLLAGDSCHQTPPFLGQGMCAGLRDAMNLAWKLDRIVRHGDPEDLLDSYESERRSHVEAFIRLAVDLGAVIQETDPERARARDADFLSGEPRMFDFPQPQLGPGLLDVTDDGRAARPVGVVFPQPRLADGRLLDDATRGPHGNRFVLLSGASSVPGLDDSMRAALAAREVVCLADEGLEITGWLAAHQAAAVLLRPDFYVMGLVRTSRDLARLVALLPP